MNPTYERGPSRDRDVGLKIPTTARHRFFFWIHCRTPTGNLTVFFNNYILYQFRDWIQVAKNVTRHGQVFDPRPPP